MKEQFLRELHDLLDKYHASIGFSVSGCSDTYGLYDERIVIDIGNETVLSVDGWWIVAADVPTTGD